MRLLLWLGRAAVFFALFAFALNNQQAAEIRWFFGRTSSAPMVFVVLGAFALGCVVGVVAMVPGWWRRRRAQGAPAPEAFDSLQLPPLPEDAPSTVPHPPRDGL